MQTQGKSLPLSYLTLLSQRFLLFNCHSYGNIPEFRCQEKNYIFLAFSHKIAAAFPAVDTDFSVASGNAQLLAAVRERQNPWTLNSLADAAGKLMFTDTDYIEKTRHLIASERERVYRELLTWEHVKVYRPYANFILVRIRKEGVTSYDVFVHAIQRGLMLRKTRP